MLGVSENKFSSFAYKSTFEKNNDSYIDLNDNYPKGNFFITQASKGEIFIKTKAKLISLYLYNLNLNNLTSY